MKYLLRDVVSGAECYRLKDSKIIETQLLIMRNGGVDFVEEGSY